MIRSECRSVPIEPENDPGSDIAYARWPRDAREV
jgi:hypothetical protein